MTTTSFLRPLVNYITIFLFVFLLHLSISINNWIFWVELYTCCHKALKLVYDRIIFIITVYLIDTNLNKIYKCNWMIILWHFFFLDVIFLWLKFLSSWYDHEQLIRIIVKMPSNIPLWHITGHWEILFAMLIDFLVNMQPALFVYLTKNNP